MKILAILVSGMCLLGAGAECKDATDDVQRALDRDGRFMFDRAHSPWSVRPLSVKSNTEIVLEEGAELVALRGAYHGEFDSLITANSVSNIVVCGLGKGATLRMWFDDYANKPYSFSEHRHIINLLSAANVRIENLRITESGGDGIYLGRGKSGEPCRNVVISKCDCDRNYRQGISVITADHLLIEDTILQNTCGTAPKAGIDFEPNNPGEQFTDCVMRNCILRDNMGAGLDMYMPSLKTDSRPVSIRIENCRIENNSIALHLETGNENPVGGNIVLAGCTLDASKRGRGMVIGRKPANALHFAMLDCTLVCPKVQKDFYPLAAHAGGCEEPLPDGMEFENLRIVGLAGVDWCKPQDENWCLTRPTNWKGSVAVGERKIVIDAEWLKSVFAVPPGKPLAKHVEGDFAKAKVKDSHPGEMRPLSMPGLRHNASLAFHVAKPMKVRLEAAYERMKDYPNDKPKCKVDLANAQRKHLKNVAKLEDGFVGEIAFDVRTAGFYFLTMKDAAKAKFTIRAANVPIAIDVTKQPQQFIYSEGTLWFEVPKGVEPEGFLTADPGEYVGCVIRDANGVEMVTIPAHNDGNLRWLTTGTGAAGLWRVDFQKPTKGAIRKYFFDLRGAPGYLFADPSRSWSFTGAAIP